MVVNGSVSEDGVDATEDQGNDDSDATERQPATRYNSPAKATRGRLPIIVIGGVVVVIVAVVAVVLSTSSSPKKGATTTPGFATFVDQKAGFSMVYPSAWAVAPATDPDVPLLLNIGEDGLNTVLVRVTALQGTVNTSNETDIKSVTDAIISGTKVNVLQQQAIKVDGLLGYYYFYSLPVEPTSGTTLVHSHFFIFPQHEMVSIIFQTVDHDFSGLAHSFDQVIASFRPTTPTP